MVSLVAAIPNRPLPAKDSLSSYPNHPLSIRASTLTADGQDGARYDIVTTGVGSWRTGTVCGQRLAALHHVDGSHVTGAMRLR